AADQAEVRLLTVHSAAEERLARPPRDLARHILLPDHVAVVWIKCPDQPLLLRRDDDVASVSSRCQRRRRRKVPVRPEHFGTVFGRIGNAATCTRRAVGSTSSRCSAAAAGACSASRHVLNTATVP